MWALIARRAAAGTRRVVVVVLVGRAHAVAALEKRRHVAAAAHDDVEGARSRGRDVGELAPDPREAQARLGQQELQTEAGSALDSRLDGVDLSSQAAGAQPAGVVVSDVNNQSPAYAAGLRKGDVITGIDHQPVASIEDLKSAVHDNQGPLLINAVRGNTELFLVLR